MSINTFGQVSKPDFAFPKTVSKTAEADLAKAEKADDAHAALNALIRLALADNMIDKASLQRSIRTAEKAAKHFEKSDESGLFDCLLATMYNSFYNQDRWKYNNRQLPLTPVSENLTEWSGEQFKAKINQLSQSALSKADALSRLKLADYADIIKADRLTLAYYPTVLDFVCSAVIETNPEIRDSAIATAEKYAAADSPAAILWYATKNNGNPQALLEGFEKQKGNVAASLLLGKYVEQKMHGYPQPIDIFDDEVVAEEEDGAEDPAKWFPEIGVPAIDDYLKRCPTAYMAGWLKDLRNGMLDQSVSTDVQPYCMVGDTITVSCEVENAPVLTISLYRLPTDWDQRQNFNSKFFAGRTPEAVKKIEITDKAPFRTKREAKFLIKKHGLYVAVPTLGNANTLRFANGVVRCVPVMPIAFSGLNSPIVATVNPLTGKPMKGVGVTLTANRTGKAYNATSDDLGLAAFGAVSDRVNMSGSMKLTYNGVNFVFSGVSPYTTTYKDERTNRTASILTDRGLYHPGDKMHLLVVASEMTADSKDNKTGKVLAGERIALSILNPNYQEIETINLITDEMGRATAEVTLPTDGLTGRFSINARGEDIYSSASVTVSDYKMPDFELKVTSTQLDTPSAGCVTLKGKASYYSGMPVANADIDVAVSRFNLWWRYSSVQVYSTKITADANGDFSVTFTADELGESDNSMYQAAFSASSPTGTTAQCTSMFSLGKKYIIMVENAESVDGEKPFSPKISVVDSDGKDARIDLLWSLKKGNDTIEKGKVGEPIDFSGVRPGEYEFVVAPADSALAAPASANIVIYNVKSGVAPTNGLWTLKTNVDYIPDRPVEALIATNEEVSLYCLLNVSNKLVSHKLMELKPGYHNISIEVPDAAVEQGRIILAYVKNYNLEISEIHFAKREDRALKLVCETFRDKLVPGAQETWKLKLTDANGNPAEGAVALDMFNKALDAIQGYNPHLNLAYVYTNNSLHLIAPYAYHVSANASMSLPVVKYDRLQAPQWQLYGYGFGYYVERSSRMLAASNMKMMAAGDMTDGAVFKEESALVTAAPMESADEEDVAEEGNAQAQEKVDYRDADVPLAIWAPMLTTDAEGNLCYTFTVPNANTTWKLTALAWTKDLCKGGMVRELVASKPIMVAPNAPRFMRQGDKCVIVASVLNNTDSACVATTVVEIFNPANGEVIKSVTNTDSLSAKGNAFASIEVEAGYDLPAIGYRVRAKNDAGFSDGEQTVIPVLTSKAALVETTPFYLNPGEKSYETALPDEAGARLSLTFCENPAWTVVTALPGLRQMDDEYANSAAAAIFSAAVAKGIIADNPEIAKALRAWRTNPGDSALVSMLEKNQDLKIALLNATPWVQAAQSQTERMASLAMTLDGKEADKAMADALVVLKKLQRADGGWAWGTWCDASSVWITANVLDMLGQLKTAGWLPADKDLNAMIRKAVNFYDSEVEDVDIMYTVVRRSYPDIPVSLNGQKVMAKTIASILKDWKKYTDPAYKALAAEALYKNNYPTKSRELMRSISEFGVMTPSQGLTFPSVNALSSYGQILRAYALIEPNAPEVDGLRQQLIIRKQGTDWGSAVVTTEVVAAILSSGSKWTAPAQGAVITVGNAELKANSVESATGSLQVDLSQYPGQKLEISTSGVGPAYGAVFAQFNKQMSEVKASACDDLDIEKTLTVRRADGSWEYADSLKVGDRVKVQLTIHSKRNLQYVEIIDERPAAFQPVDQLPGWIWSEGVGFYRENRDSYTALHVEYMRPGTYILSYEMTVGQAGTFSSGVASIQSQYAPEISAHSSGTTLSTNN